MAASMTFTYEAFGPIVKVIADWTSAADGSAAGTTAVKVIGELVKAVTDPGATAPTANYDITITDEEGVDVLGACEDALADRHTSTTEQRYFFVLDTAATPLAQPIQPVVADKLTVTIANAGDSKVGQLILYVRGSLHGSW